MPDGLLPSPGRRRWARLRARILQALAGHPEARRDVLAALAGPGA